MSAPGRLVFMFSAYAGLAACNHSIDVANINDPSPCAEQGAKVCEADCEAGDSAACLVASLAYGGRDRTKMMDYEQRACEGGVAQGCRFYANNFGPSTDAPDLDKAREYYQRGCDGADVPSCRWLIGDALGPADDGDDRTMRDPQAARALWQHACSQDPSACAGLADLETLGLGGPKDRDSALEHYGTACDADNSHACYNLKTTHPEVLLQDLNFAMFEVLSSADPNLAVLGAMPGHIYDIEVATCFEAGSLSAMRAYVLDGSDSPAVDEAVLDTVRQWHARARAPFPEGVAGCIHPRFVIKVDPHVPD